MAATKNRYSLIVLVLFLLAIDLYAHVSYEVKLVILTGHLQKTANAKLYRLRLDKEGRFVINLGLLCGLEYYLYRDKVALKFAQALLLDCGLQPAGFTHLGLRLHVRDETSDFVIGNGPTWFYRRDWQRLPNYVDEGLFQRWNGLQYRFFWYAGEVGYSWQLADRRGVSLTLIPGPPLFFTIAPGWRFEASDF